jgi:hypothetical protein
MDAETTQAFSGQVQRAIGIGLLDLEGRGNGTLGGGELHDVSVWGGAEQQSRSGGFLGYCMVFVETEAVCCLPQGG